MLPAVRKAALAAVSKAPSGQPTAAAAAAATVPSVRALSGGGGGMVAGQDTPVSLEDLPDNVKSQFETTVQAPGASPASSKEGDQQAGSSGAGDGQQEGEPPRHPGPQQDPYSGSDPTQGGKE